jgi:hypothetical protein
MIEPFALPRQADQAPAFGGHDVDLGSRGELGSAN